MLFINRHSLLLRVCVGQRPEARLPLHSSEPETKRLGQASFLTPRLTPQAADPASVSSQWDTPPPYPRNSFHCLSGKTGRKGRSGERKGGGRRERLKDTPFPTLAPTLPGVFPRGQAAGHRSDRHSQPHFASSVSGDLSVRSSSPVTAERS